MALLALSSRKACATRGMMRGCRGGVGVFVFMVVGVVTTRGGVMRAVAGGGGGRRGLTMAVGTWRGF